MKLKFSLFFIIIFITSFLNTKIYSQCFKYKPAVPEIFLMIDNSIYMEIKNDPQIMDQYFGSDMNSLPPSAFPACVPAGGGTLNAAENSRTDPIAKEYKDLWIALLDILNGSANKFFCSAIDRTSSIYPYSLPGGVPDAGVTPDFFMIDSLAPPDQTVEPDGLIDIFADKIKFGYASGDHNISTLKTYEGDWSYGDNYILTDPETGADIIVNRGLSNSDKYYFGKFMPFVHGDEKNQIYLNNQMLQIQIYKTHTYGYVSMTEKLYDFLYYVEHDEHFKKDKFNACRDRAVVIITLGLPYDFYQFENSNKPFNPKAADVAATLYNQYGIKTYVFNWFGWKKHPELVEKYNEVALSGGTDSAILVETDTELMRKLLELFNLFTYEGDSRATSAITTATKNFTDVQYQFNVGYQKITDFLNNVDREGIVEWDIYRCDDSCNEDTHNQGAEICEVLSLSDILNETPDNERYIFTQQNGLKVPFDHDNITADMMNIPTSGQVPDMTISFFNDFPYYAGKNLGDVSSSDIRDKFKNQLIDYVYGTETSRRYNHKMGAINHTTPAISAAPPLNITVPGYALFKEAHKNRITTLFVMTNEGLVHAFRVDKPANILPSEIGRELWAFLPKYQLQRIHELADGFKFLADGALVVKDILLKRTFNMTEQEASTQWKTILVGTYGEGGRGLFALDVTDPDNLDNNKFLWEIYPRYRCFNNDEEGQGCVTTDEYKNLGLTVSKPVIGVVYVENYLDFTSPMERAVLIIGGGQNPDPNDTDPEHKKIGKSVFVIDLKTGKKVFEFSADVQGSVEDPENLKYDMIGDVTAYNTFPGRTIVKAYLGDAGGGLWRLDLSSPNVVDWKMKRFYATEEDTKEKSITPIKNAPTFAIDKNWGRPVIVFTTGGIDYIEESGLTHYAVSMIEDIEIKNGVPVFVKKIRWQHKFEKGEVPTSRPIVFNEVAYFSTYKQNLEDPCNVGESRLYGVDYINKSISGGKNDFMGRLFDPDAVDDLYYKYENTIIKGIQLIWRPSCTLEGSMDYAWWKYFNEGGAMPLSGQMGAGRFEIVGQTGAGGPSSPGSVPAGTSKKPKIGKIGIKVNTAVRNVIISSWGLIFE